MIVFILSALQISLVNSLSGIFSNLNLILIFLVYAVGLSKKIFTWCLAFGAGLFFDLTLFSPFGLYLFGIVITIALVYFLHINFLTNQSVYTYLVLIIAATVTFRIWSYLFYSLNSFFANIDTYIILNKIFWFNQLSAIFLNVIFTAILFYFLAFISRRLRPVFLLPKTR